LGIQIPYFPFAFNSGGSHNIDYSTNTKQTMEEIHETNKMPFLVGMTLKPRDIPPYPKFNQPFKVPVAKNVCALIMESPKFRPELKNSLERVMDNAEENDGFVKIKYQAEHPDASPTKEIMAHYGVIGMPAYRVLKVK